MDYNVAKELKKGLAIIKAKICIKLVDQTTTTPGKFMFISTKES